MMPVPSYQLVQFLDWLHQRQVRLSIDHFNRDQLLGLALEYLRSEKLMPTAPDRYDLELLLRVFQSCPMIREDDVLGQMRHFAGCGRCIEYIQERGQGYMVLTLHPFLRKFVDYAERSGFRRWVTQSLRGDVRDRHHNGEDIRHRMGDSFHRAIRTVGPRLEEEFRRFVAECPPTLIRDYEIECHAEYEGRPGRNRPAHRGPILEEGADPITGRESPEDAAHRLVGSVEELLRGGYYDQAIAADHQLSRFLAISTDFPEDLAQSLEFLAWVLDQHPDLDVAGDIPSDQLNVLVQTFCEANEYSNAGSFGKTVQRWMSGAASETILQRLRSFLWGRHDHRLPLGSKASPFRRYQSVRMHGMFLFLSTGDFPAFIDKHWRDLNALTADSLDVYFSKEDLKKRVSGYETLSEFKSLRIPVAQLPGLILWEQSLKDARAVPLGGLEHDEIMEVMKRVVHRIGAGDSLEVVVDSATDFATSLLEKRRPGITELVNTKIVINGGDNIMNDKYEVSGQAGAVGRHAHAHDMAFNQIWAEQSKSVDLPALAAELSRLRVAMREEASTAETDIAVGAVANAEVSAREGNGTKTMEYLKLAGKTALSWAEKIGTGVAVAAIKAALGL